MSSGALALFGADVAIGITGIAGPGGENGNRFPGGKPAGFINIRGDGVKGNTGQGQQFAAAGRTGRQDQFLHESTPFRIQLNLFIIS